MLERDSEGKAEQKLTVIQQLYSSKGMESMKSGDCWSLLNIKNLINHINGISFGKFDQPKLFLYFANLNLIMQEFGPISNSVQNKRQGLMRDIQNIARDSIKKRARS